jgi:hypothetical protein
MVRPLNQPNRLRSTRKGERLIVVPGENSGWEVWRFPLSGASEYQQSIPADSELAGIPFATFGLPVRSVFSMPMWIRGANSTDLAAAIELQLEALTNRGGVSSWSIAHKSDGNWLLSVSRLSAPLPKEWVSRFAESYDLASRFYEMSANSLTLWKEQGRLCLGVTRGKTIVYFQDLGVRSIIDCAADLTSILMSLEMRGIVASLNEIVAWFDLHQTEQENLQARLNLPVRSCKKPAPTLPVDRWDLTPLSVRDTKVRVGNRRTYLRYIALAALLYIAVAAALLGRLYYTQREAAQVQLWMEQHQAALDTIQQSQTVWTSLQLVVDQDHYPLENLLHCQTAVTSADFRLTRFEQNNGDLILKGEGRNALAAEAFAQRIQHDPHFSGYSWEIGAPTVLSNDLASLEIHAYAPTHQQ